ncbi:BatA domain-containing protein [Candidatus Woesearchaeota archaeon]|nr:BatA domain-containing protein [Candidatus Woesearchaeota archaeon]
MVFKFGNILGLYTFSTIVPLIIVYLIRPKPTKIKVPSLMFFIKHTNVSKIQSLFRYFQNDLLFFIQLLVLLLLAFSIAQPVLTLNRDAVSGNIVFILDVSASSQVIEEGNITRLDIAKEKIRQLATSKNSLILLKSHPILALQDVSKSKLINYINGIGSTDDLSDAASAISLAGDLLNNQKGRVVVLSDFIESKGVDADVAKNVLESRGIHVDFVDTKNSIRNNVGIINMVIKAEDVNIYLKNYNNFSKVVSLKINKDMNKLSLGPGNVEPFVFTLADNLTNIEILDSDDFNLDNKVLITKPYSDKINILLVTNNPSKFIKAALSSVDDVVLTVAEPPIIPNEDFDIYIIDNIDRNKIVVDTFGGMMRKIHDNGKAAVIVVQHDSNKIDFEELLPVKFNNIIEGGLVYVQQINKFTKDIDFGSLKRIYSIEDDSISIASVNDTSVISLFKLGKGNVIYYGIMDEENDFKLTPGYPIFWNSLISFLAGRGDLNEINLRTGTIFDLGNETRVLDKQGIYKFGEKNIAVNLLNDIESDINFVDHSSDPFFVKDKLINVKSDIDYDLTLHASVLALMLILFELFYIRFRGEI